MNCIPIKLYLAGKISQNDWRHQIIADLRSANWLAGINGSCGDPPAPRDLLKFRAISLCTSLVQPTGRLEIEYVGPFFIACDHGCFHRKNSHGSVDFTTDDHDREELDAIIQGNAKHQIRACSVFLAYLDGDEHCSAYGTIAEIGYAAALGKTVILAGPGINNPDLWFVRQFTSASRHFDSVSEALEALASRKI